MVLSYLHFVVLLIYGGLALYLLVRGPRSTHGYYAVLVLLSLAIWSAGHVVMTNPLAGKEVAKGGVNLAAVGWTTFGALFVLFAVAWTCRPGIASRWWVHALLWLPAAWFMRCQVKGLLFTDLRREWFGWDGRWATNPWTAAYLTFDVLTVTVGMILLGRHALAAESKAERRSSLLLSLSAGAGLTAGMVTDALAPLAGWRAVPLVGNVAGLFWAAALVFAMIRHRFMAPVPALAAGDIVATMSDLLFLLDQRTRIVFVNRAVVRALRRSTRELEGVPFEEIVAPESRHLTTEWLRDTERLRTVRLHLRTSEGYLMPVAATFATWRGPDGRQAGTICTARDITLEDAAEETLAKSREELAREVELQTRELRAANEQLSAEIAERRRVEQELRDSEERFRLLFEYAPDACYINDLQGTFVDGNRKAEELTGYDRQELIGKNMLSTGLLSGKDIVRAGVHLTANALGKPTGPDEFVLRRKDGSTVDVEISTHPLESGGRRLVLGIARDITVRKKAQREHERHEEQRRQLEKLEALGQLAGGIAHDFNNMLGAIMGNADILRVRLSTDAPQHLRYAERILDVARRSADLTGRLLAFARKGPQSLAPLDVHEVIRDTIELLRHSADRRITIVEELLATTSSVLGDRTMIENALLNLGLNARDALPEGGRITFATATVELTAERIGSRPPYLQPGTYVRVDVRDTGVGMDEHTRAHLFEPYFTTKPPGKGTGLGLASVLGTAQAHGGMVEVQSEVGHGSTFSLYLPVAATLRHSHGHPAEPPTP